MLGILGLSGQDTFGCGTAMRSRRSLAPAASRVVGKICHAASAERLSRVGSSARLQCEVELGNMTAALRLRLTQKADVYALGIISYQVYTGQDPPLNARVSWRKSHKRSRRGNNGRFQELNYRRLCIAKGDAKGPERGSVPCGEPSLLQCVVFTM